MADHPNTQPSPTPDESRDSPVPDVVPSVDPKTSSGPVEWMASGDDDILIDSDGAAEEADEDSLFGDASAMSIASSINHYRIENNRRYHTYRDGSYWVPHDAEALKLDNYAHLLFLLTLNDRLFLAPLDNPKTVIDVGTGIGIWAQNFADRYPDADVLGTDLSNVQKDYPAPNLHFVLDDCCSEWVYPLDHFDYIHVRLLYGSVADWPAFYKECLDHLKPGGFLEHSEINPVTKSDDGTKVEGDAFDESGKLAEACGQKTGKAFDIQPHIKDMILEAGFTNVVEHTFKWPIGDWPSDPRLKEMGAVNARHWIEGIEAWTMRLLTQNFNWTPERVTKWCQGLKQAIRSRKHHVYQPVSVVYAQKPL